MIIYSFVHPQGSVTEVMHIRVNPVVCNYVTCIRGASVVSQFGAAAKNGDFLYE